jgi:hypothetical protein
MIWERKISEMPSQSLSSSRRTSLCGKKMTRQLTTTSKTFEQESYESFIISNIIPRLV